MRKVLSIFIIVVSLSAYATDALTNSKSKGELSEVLKVFYFYELTDQVLNEVMQGNHPEIAVGLPQGALLPLHFFLKGNLFHFIENEVDLGQIEIQQTIYLRYIAKELIVSSDLLEWKPFLEFITGQASVTLRIQNEKPSVLFGAEVNQRI